MIEDYLEQKSKQKELEKLIAWRDFYLQDKITWDKLQKALEQRKKQEQKTVELPICNLYSAIGVDRLINKL